LAGFERLGRGAMLVDPRARVIEYNACVRFGDGLLMTGGVLQTARAADRDRLQRFLRSVIKPDRGVVSGLVTLTLPRPSGMRPWLLDGIACHGTNRSNGAGAALLLITDVERPGRLSHELLAQVFGLTLVEAKLARELACGKCLQDISAQLAISMGHARQRLKAVFDKTGTSRQGELIALLAKLG
jgi:DNA-binding CsgD family transcriptional regulator